MTPVCQTALVGGFLYDFSITNMNVILIYTHVSSFLSEKLFYRLAFYRHFLFKKKKAVEHVSGICNSFSIMFSTLI